MIDYDSYKKIIEYLDKNELEELRKYVEEENNANYIKNAREQLTKFLRSCSLSYYAYNNKQIDNSILIGNHTSVYHLKTDEILTNYRIKCINKFEYLSQDIIEKSKEVLRDCSSKNTILVDFISKSDQEVRMCNSGNNVECSFDRRLYDYSRYFLGEGAKYGLIEDIPEHLIGCMAESDKGIGLILGLKKKER